MCMLAHLKVWNQLVAKSFYRYYALHIPPVLSNESVARRPHFHPIQNSPSCGVQLQLWRAHSSASITSNYSRHWMPATISFKLYLMQYALLHYNYCYFRSDRYCYLTVILLYCTTKVLCTFYHSIMYYTTTGFRNSAPLYNAATNLIHPYYTTTDFPNAAPLYNAVANLIHPH
jgi:hypothetical protein